MGALSRTALVAAFEVAFVVGVGTMVVLHATGVVRLVDRERQPLLLVMLLISPLWVFAALIYTRKSEIAARRPCQGGIIYPEPVVNATCPVQELAIGHEAMCVVCLEPVCVGQPSRQLHCGHTFHSGCIDGWWRWQPQKRLHCPTCRHITAPPGSVIPPVECEV
mmetsp:Transcript_119381/g.234563  ORF Transcript_119381/g.234563 Transcript_119381/m.234563 type:complete len:164 (-) Transcript_119381:26-517(-)